MTLEVEEVVDGGVAGQEALSRAGRLEALHLAFSSPGRLVRILRPVVPSSPLLVARRDASTGSASGGNVAAAARTPARISAPNAAPSRTRLRSHARRGGPPRRGS